MANKMVFFAQANNGDNHGHIGLRGASASNDLFSNGHAVP